MIEAHRLGKKYGPVHAVEDLSFRVESGVVTGFLGPNGAGKSTTMRLMLGLDHGTGRTVFNGRAYSELVDPARTVGVLLDARAVHPGRTAVAHLRMIARGAGLPLGRVESALESTGLTGVANRRAGGFSLGMMQRLGLAAALLGDPEILLLDEPANGLDPEGVRWMRDLLRGFAAEGRTVFVSSHLLNEMTHLADDLVVIGGGRLIAAEPIESFVGRNSVTQLSARTPTPGQLVDVLHRSGFRAVQANAGTVVVESANAQAVAELAMRSGLLLTELTHGQTSLEDAFFAATAGSAQFTGRVTP